MLLACVIVKTTSIMAKMANNVLVIRLMFEPRNALVTLFSLRFALV